MTGPNGPERPTTEAGRHPDPLIEAWREFTIRFATPSDPIRHSESPIREAFAAGWDAAAAGARAAQDPDHDTLAQAIHDSGIAGCRVECVVPVGGGFSGADYDYATLLIREYASRRAPAEDGHQ